MKPEIIFKNTNSSISWHFSNNLKRTDKCVVIFCGLGHRSIFGKVKGTDPALREGIDVISIQSNNDDWHQSIYPEGINELSKVLKKNYRTTFGYGTSMGAFAAILYAKKLCFKSVLALSPQFTIDDQFEPRWSEYFKKINWKFEMKKATNYNGNIFILYDPINPDVNHVRKFKKFFKFSRLIDMPIKFSSHPVTYYLKDANCLKDLFVSFIKEDKFNITLNNKNNKTYLQQISIHLREKGKYKSALICLKKCFEINPENRKSYRIASDINFNLSRFKDAEDMIIKAINSKDANAQTKENDKIFLEKIKNKLSS